MTAPPFATRVVCPSVAKSAATPAIRSPSSIAAAAAFCSPPTTLVAVAAVCVVWRQCRCCCFCLPVGGDVSFLGLLGQVSLVLTWMTAAEPSRPADSAAASWRFGTKHFSECGLLPQPRVMRWWVRNRPPLFVICCGSWFSSLSSLLPVVCCLAVATGGEIGIASGVDGSTAGVPSVADAGVAGGEASQRSFACLQK